MNNNKKKIDIVIPEIDLEDIESIVSKGIKPKISFITYLKESFKELGFNNIFHDKAELTIIILVGIILLLIPMANLGNLDISDLYKFTFIVSPMIYLSAVIFSFYNSKEKGAFDIEMTCKYNLYQLSALRMFVFSIASIIINTFSIIIIGVISRNIDVIRMIIISIAGLFIFSTIFLYSLLNLKWSFSKYFVIGGWLCINILLSKMDNKIYEEFLIKAPLYIHLIISGICMILYIKNLNKLISYRRKKGEI